MVGVLTEAGFDSIGSVVAHGTIIHHLVSAVQTQRLSALSDPGTAVTAELSAAEFPCQTETAGIAREVSPEEEFRRGPTRLLSGLRSKQEPGWRRPSDAIELDHRRTSNDRRDPFKS